MMDPVEYSKPKLHISRRFGRVYSMTASTLMERPGKAIKAVRGVLKHALKKLGLPGRLEEVRLNRSGGTYHLNLHYHLEKPGQSFGGSLIPGGKLLFGHLPRTDYRILDIRYNNTLYFQQPGALSISDLREGVKARELLIRSSSGHDIYYIGLRAKNHEVGVAQVSLLVKPDGCFANSLEEARVFSKIPRIGQPGIPVTVSGSAATQAIERLTDGHPLLKAYIDLQV